MFCASPLIVRETYENLPTKSLPNNFFTNMSVNVCNNGYKNVQIQLPWELGYRYMIFKLDETRRAAVHAYASACCDLELLA